MFALSKLFICSKNESPVPNLNITRNKNYDQQFAKNERRHYRKRLQSFDLNRTTFIYTWRFYLGSAQHVFFFHTSLSIIIQLGVRNWTQAAKLNR